MFGKPLQIHRCGTAAAAEPPIFLPSEEMNLIVLQQEQRHGCEFEGEFAPCRRGVIAAEEDSCVDHAVRSHTSKVNMSPVQGRICESSPIVRETSQ